MSFFRTGPDSGERAVIEEACAVFEAGRIALITGATGAGKTTLLHLLAVLLRPTRGEVRADGEPVSRWISPHRDLWRRKVGFVFQAPHLIDDLTVLENVLVPGIPIFKSLNALRHQGLQRLAEHEIAHLAAKPVRSLSGGERQKVSIARAFLLEPPFLLADEPTAHQDDAGCERLFDRLVRAGKRNTTVIVATHDPRISESGIAQDHWRLDQGRLEKLK